MCPRAHLRINAAFTAAVVTVVALIQVPAEGQSAAPAPGVSPPAIVSVMSGPSGEARDGRFFIPSPRTRFRVPDDTEIVVYFEWAGSPGTYALTGTWRGPGNVSSSSEFTHTTRDRRIAAYWRLPLTPTMPLGDWTLEARIDGQLAGSHQFQVVGPEAPPVPSAPARRLPLERRDAYARVLALTARIETYDSGGVRLDSGPAALLDGDLVATSFSRLNNAARARIRVGNTAPVEVTDVVAFNRRQDWAVFHVPGAWPTAVPAVARADAEVGEVCYSATASPDGGMAVSTGEVVGTGDHATAGRRLYTTCAPSWESAGAPVLNEYGDVIGMVAAGTFPGVTAFARIGISDLSTLRIPVVPGALLQAAPAPAARTSFASLAQRGLFTPPVTMERQVLSGGFSTGIVRDGSATRPIDQRDQFTLRDNTVTTFVSWLAVEAFKGTAALRLYDLDNTLRAESPPSKVTLRKGDLKMMTWDLPRPAPGMYRVDILLGTAIAWRGHFQVVE